MKKLYENLLTWTIIAIILISLSMVISYKNDGKDRYCKENGWDGLRTFTIFCDEEFKCYKEVPSKTGLGKETILSGYNELNCGD